MFSRYLLRMQYSCTIHDCASIFSRPKMLTEDYTAAESYRPEVVHAIEAHSVWAGVQPKRLKGEALQGADRIDA